MDISVYFCIYIYFLMKIIKAQVFGWTIFERSFILPQTLWVIETIIMKQIKQNCN